MTKRALWAVAAVFLWAAAAVAAEPGPAVTGGSQKTLFENDRVKTYEVVLQKGGEIAMHTHAGEHQVYVIAGGTIRGTDKDGKTTDTSFKNGEVVLVPALSHSVKNVGKSTIRAIVTELKEAPERASLSSGERSELVELYRKGTQELIELVSSTPDELWAKKPAPDRWSVAETVEHIATAESLLFSLAKGALDAPADPNWASVQGTMGADQILGFMQNRTQKFQAPEPVQPKGGMSRADALALYGGNRLQTVEFVRRTDGELKKHVAALPVGQMTAHQVLLFIGGHNLRHNAQIRETLEQLKK